MKYISLVLLSLLPFMGLGQELKVAGTQVESVTATVNLAKEEINLTSEINKTGKWIQNLQLIIQNGEIVISYDLTQTSEEDQYYEVNPEIQLNGESLKLLLVDELEGDLGSPITAGSRQITWINPMDRYLNIEGELSVTLTVKLWGIYKPLYPCELGEPTFTQKQRLPYYITAGAGLASLGIGRLLKNQSDDIYNNQYLTSQTNAEAQPFYDEANGKHQTYLVLTYAGAAILVTDAVLYMIRQSKYKKNLKLYERECLNKSVSFAPTFDFPSLKSPNGSAGVNISISF